MSPAGQIPLGNPEFRPAESRESRSVVGVSPRMDSISTDPNSPDGYAPGTVSAAQAFSGSSSLAGPRPPYAVGHAPREGRVRQDLFSAPGSQAAIETARSASRNTGFPSTDAVTTAPQSVGEPAQSDPPAHSGARSFSARNYAHMGSHGNWALSGAPGPSVREHAPPRELFQRLRPSPVVAPWPVHALPTRLAPPRVKAK